MERKQSAKLLILLVLIALAGMFTDVVGSVMGLP